MRSGSLQVIGLGPGDPALLPPLAKKALKAAETVVAYKNYLTLVSPTLLHNKKIISTGMTGEVERVTMAIQEAESGHAVCILCSGDPGIYAMAGLALEILESRASLDRIHFEVIPGIPAFTAAAALLGAPLMHDFASISLSDLLTPWPSIAKRLKYAALADFVIILYNPRSKNRPEHVQHALNIIQKHRLPNTPVGIVRQAYREKQHIVITSLQAIDITAIDMQTLLIIGNSTTRNIGQFLLTPRGYAQKYTLNSSKAQDK